MFLTMCVFFRCLPPCILQRSHAKSSVLLVPPMNRYNWGPWWRSSTRILGKQGSDFSESFPAWGFDQHIFVSPVVVWFFQQGNRINFALRTSKWAKCWPLFLSMCCIQNPWNKNWVPFNCSAINLIKSNEVSHVWCYCETAFVWWGSIRFCMTLPI